MKGAFDFLSGFRIESDPIFSIFDEIKSRPSTIGNQDRTSTCQCLIDDQAPSFA